MLLGGHFCILRLRGHGGVSAILIAYLVDGASAPCALVEGLMARLSGLGANSLSAWEIVRPGPNH